MCIRDRLELGLRHISQTARSFVAPEDRDTQRGLVGNRLLLQARAAQSGCDQQRVLVQAFADNACTSEHGQALKNLFDGTDTLQGLEIDVDLRWTMLINLVRLGLASESDIVALEQEDATMTGAQKAAEARAAQNDPAVKTTVWDQILRDPSLANDTRWAMATGFWAQAASAPALYEPFIADFFASVEDVWANNTFHTAEDMVVRMYPTALAGYTATDIVAAGQQWLQEHDQAPAALVRIIRERNSVCLLYTSPSPRD